MSAEECKHCVVIGINMMADKPDQVVIGDKEGVILNDVNPRLSRALRWAFNQAVEEKEKQNAELKEELAQVKIDEIIEQAHMAGQVFAGIDPSYSEARVYRIKALSEAQGETTATGEDHVKAEEKGE